MPNERDDDEEQKTLQQHTELLTELPRTAGPFWADLYLYRDNRLYQQGVLGAMLMQTHFNHRSTDIFLSSFMKCGTTWLRSLMFTTLNRSGFSFSNHPLLHKGPHDCFPFLDLYKPEDHSYSEALPSPRLFATHYGHKLLPSCITEPTSGCKFVYVCRDPKDVLVSLWHFIIKVRSKQIPPVSVSLNQVFQMFCEGVVAYGSYWDHVLGFWNASVKSPGKISFFKYEEMKSYLEIHVKKLAEFMGVPISVQEEANGMVKKIADFCSFDHLTSLEVNKSGVHRTNHGATLQNKTFFRRGEVGDWKCHLTKEMKDKVDLITRDKLKGSGLTLGATRV